MIKMQEKISISIAKSIIYKLVREKELCEQEKKIIDKIIEEKDYDIRDQGFAS